MEVVGKVMMMACEVNGLASVMTKSAKVKAEVAGAGVVMMIETLEAVIGVETLPVAVEDGKVIVA